MNRHSLLLVRIAPGKDPIRFFDMNLTRIGDTNWPTDGAVSPTDK